MSHDFKISPLWQSAFAIQMSASISPHMEAITLQLANDGHLHAKSPIFLFKNDQE